MSDETRARWVPHALALLAYEAGDSRATVTVIDDLGDVDALPASWFFRTWESMPPIERLAVELCEGRVLDLGAGAGSHALVLQERGHPVTATEVLPELVELMRRRGVLDARAGSVFRPPAGTRDTVLLLMNGWGLMETVTGLQRFLADAKELLAPGGRIIADSTDMRRFATGTIDEGGVALPCREDGRYVGEIQYQLEFEGRRGHPFGHLYVDPDTLRLVATRTGWEVEIAAHGENGAYLSVLRRSGE